MASEQQGSTDNARGKRTPATTHSRGGELLLRLVRVKRGQRGFCLVLPPGTQPSSPTWVGGTVCEEEMSGKCILMGVMQQLRRRHRTGKGWPGHASVLQGWPGALRLCQDQFQAASSLVTSGTQFMLFGHLAVNVYASHSFCYNGFPLFILDNPS